MKMFLSFYCCILLLFVSCQNNKKDDPLKVGFRKVDTGKTGIVKKVNYWDKIQNSIPKNLKPVFGYRFIVKGDFDGDGKTEHLIEHFFSRRDKKETNKFYDSLNYDQLVFLTGQKEPFSFLSCSNNRIDTLQIADISQLLGVSFLRNEGDLNSDGSDEISYVVDWADWSSTNTCHLMTYKNKKWQELLRIPIWDWQLPELPFSFAQYGYFGVQERKTINGDDGLNHKLQKHLIRFPGFITKKRTNKIQVRFRNKDADPDTLIIDLRHPKKLE